MIGRAARRAATGVAGLRAPKPVPNGAEAEEGSPSEGAPQRAAQEPTTPPDGAPPLKAQPMAGGEAPDGAPPRVAPRSEVPRWLQTAAAWSWRLLLLAIML